MNRWLVIPLLLPAVACDVSQELQGPGATDAGPVVNDAEARPPPDANASSDSAFPTSDSAVSPPPPRDAGMDAASGMDASVACQGTQGTVIATEAANGWFSLGLDATNVYWTFFSTDPGAVRTVSKTGGSPTTIADAELQPWEIAVAGTNVYWADTGLGALSSVRWVPTSGGQPGTFAPNSAYNLLAQGLVADSANLYWGGTNGAILVQPLGGGAATNLIPGEAVSALDVAVDATHVYWTGVGPASSSTPAGVWALSKGGGVAQNVAAFDTVGVVPRIAADATGVYWSTPQGQIMMVPSIGASPVTLATNQTVNDLAIDGTFVYWVAGTSVLKTPIGGGALTTLASLESPVSIAVDDAFVYWGNYCGQIKKIGK